MAYLRFIHIIPNSINTFAYKILIQIRPPLSRFRLSKIRERTCTGPSISMKLLILYCFYPYVFCCTRLIDKITCINLSTRIYHPCRVKATDMKVSIQSSRVWKCFRIKCKNAIAIHIINIHPHHITRNTFDAESICNLNHTTGWRIRESTLLIT